MLAPRCTPKRSDFLVSRIPPFYYIILYIALIPTWSLFYIIGAPHGFYAPYAHLEPSAQADAAHVAVILQGALARSVDMQSPPALTAGNWRLDWHSIQVDSVNATEVGKLRFRVFINADGFDQRIGAKQLGWSASISIDERPIAERIAGPNDTFVYRVPEIDTSKYMSPFNAHDSDISGLLFSSRQVAFDSAASVFTVNAEEDTELRRFMRGANGDPSSFSNQFLRMTYLSAVVITTLGLGDIVPVTSTARFLVAMEAVFGIVVAGLFLNALAHRAGKKD